MHYISIHDVWILKLTPKQSVHCEKMCSEKLDSSASNVIHKHDSLTLTSLLGTFHHQLILLSVPQLLLWVLTGQTTAKQSQLQAWTLSQEMWPWKSDVHPGFPTQYCCLRWTSIRPQEMSTKLRPRLVSQYGINVKNQKVTSLGLYPHPLDCAPHPSSKCFPFWAKRAKFIACKF